MKKLLTVLLSLLMVLSLVGCSSNKTETTTTTTEETAAGVTIGFVTDVGGIDDKSFNQTTYEGLTQFKNENPTAEVNYLQSNNDADYVPNLTTFADEGVDLVAAAGFLFADAICEVLNNYPEQKAIVIDVNWLDEAAYPNLKQVAFAVEQGTYLAGIAAGMKAVENGSKHVGMIIGNEASSMDPFYAGFQQGVWAVDADIVIDYDNAASFNEPEKGKSLADKQYNNGATVIFACAGSTGNGVFANAVERRKAGEDVWVIGVDTDQYDLGIYDGTASCALTSAMKRVDVAAYDAANEVANGTFKGGVVTYTLADKGVSLPTENPNLSEEVLAKVAEATDAIVSGAIVVSQTAVYGDTDARVNGLYGSAQ